MADVREDDNLELNYIQYTWQLTGAYGARWCVKKRVHFHREAARHVGVWGATLPINFFGAEPLLHFCADVS
jgi:hypothetical protein